MSVPQERFLENRLYQALDNGWFPLKNRVRAVNRTLQLSDSQLHIPDINGDQDGSSLFISIDSFLETANHDAPKNAVDNYQPIDMLRALARSRNLDGSVTNYRTMVRDERRELVASLFNEVEGERTSPARDYLLTYLLVSSDNRREVWEKGIRPAFQHEVRLHGIIQKRHKIEGKTIGELLGMGRKLNSTDTLGNLLYGPIGTEFDVYYDLMQEFYNEAQFFASAGIELPVWCLPTATFEERVASVDQSSQTAVFEYREMQLAVNRTPEEFAQALLDDLVAHADYRIGGQMIADLNSLMAKRILKGHSAYESVPNKFRRQLDEVIDSLVKVKADQLGMSMGEFAFVSLSIHQALIGGFDGKDKKLSQRQVEDLYVFMSELLRSEGGGQKIERYSQIMAFNWSLYFSKGNNIDVGKLKAFIKDQSVVVQARTAVESGMVGMTYLSNYRPNMRDDTSRMVYDQIMGELKETIEVARRQSLPRAKTYRLQ